MLFRETETLYLRRLASTPEIRLDPKRNFETDRLNKVNQLLTNISLEISNTDVEFRSLFNGETIDPQQISNGESEAVSLASEILYFFDTIDPAKFNVLLLDAPFFGHPLSLSLSDDVALILEGEDDERVWQQAARTSQGKIKVFPVLADSVNQQGALETFCIQLLNTLYDNPVAFSIRDGDGVVGQPLEHRLPLRRYRLQCYAIENALLTDSCLSVMGTSWEEFVTKAWEWIKDHSGHPETVLIEELVRSSDRLRHKKIKNIRNLICDIAGCKKPWEVVVGQAIAKLTREDLANSNMLIDFLGAEMVSNVIFRDDL